MTEAAPQRTPLSKTGPMGGSGEMFDRIAHRYDMLNRIISLGVDQGWRKRAVDAARVPPGGRVLDLATGTGDLAIQLSRAYPTAQVVGTDPSVQMLQVGRTKLADGKLTERVTLEEGDAQGIELQDQTMDAVTIAFGIRNVPDRDAALREMARVTKPSGRVVILELTEPTGGWMAPLARFHVHHVVPRLGALLSGDQEYRYLQRSIEAFPTPAEFAAQMDTAGLAVLRVEPLTFGVCTLFVAHPKGQHP